MLACENVCLQAGPLQAVWAAEVSGSLELELQMIVSHRVGAARAANVLNCGALSPGNHLFLSVALRSGFKNGGCDS